MGMQARLIGTTSLFGEVGHPPTPEPLPRMIAGASSGVRAVWRKLLGVARIRRLKPCGDNASGIIKSLPVRHRQLAAVAKREYFLLEYAEADRRTLADLPLEKTVQMNGTASSLIR